MNEYLLSIIIIFGILFLQIYFFSKAGSTRTLIKNLFSYFNGKKDKIDIYESNGTTIVIQSSKLKTVTDLNRNIESSKEELESLIVLINRKNKRLSKEKLKYDPDESIIVSLQEEIDLNAENVKLITEDIELKTLEIDVILSMSNNSFFGELNKSINDYLIENKGLATDFHIIKDMTDRKCSVFESKLNTYTPMPLYMGLIGTMLGVLFGVGKFVFGGGLESLLGDDSSNIGIGISDLLGGIALAMATSIIGIIFTSINSAFNTRSMSILNKDKDDFFNWIQCNLLPMMSDSTTTALNTLQSNLNLFNESFSANIKDMSNAFSDMKNNSKEQAELLNTIERIGVTKMAKANVEVLQQLERNTTQFSGFTDYIDGLNSYLIKLESLNSNMDDQLKRTETVEKMGKFFEAEIKQIEERKHVISETIGSIDRLYTSSIEEIRSKTEVSISTFKEFMGDQDKQLREFVEEQRNVLKESIKEQNIIFEEKMSETTKIVDELKNLSDVKSSMQSLEKATHDQNQKIDFLANAILELVKSKKTEQAITDYNDFSNVPSSNRLILDSWTKKIIFGSIAVLGVSGIIFICSAISILVFSIYK